MLNVCVPLSAVTGRSTVRFSRLAYAGGDRRTKLAPERTPAPIAQRVGPP